MNILKTEGDFKAVASIILAINAVMLLILLIISLRNLIKGNSIRYCAEWGAWVYLFIVFNASIPAAVLICYLAKFIKSLI